MRDLGSPFLHGLHNDGRNNLNQCTYCYLESPAQFKLLRSVLLHPLLLAFSFRPRVFLSFPHLVVPLFPLLVFLTSMISQLVLSPLQGFVELRDLNLGPLWVPPFHLFLFPRALFAFHHQETGKYGSLAGSLVS